MRVMTIVGLRLVGVINIWNQKKSISEKNNTKNKSKNLFIYSLRVFLLGPCHHVYMQGLGLSSLQVYETPIGNIEIDVESNNIFYLLIYFYSKSYWKIEKTSKI